MPIEHAHAIVDRLAKLLELAGTAVIVGGIALAALTDIIEVHLHHGSWRDSNEPYLTQIERCCSCQRAQSHRSTEQGERR